MWIPKACQDTLSISELCLSGSLKLEKIKSHKQIWSLNGMPKTQVRKSMSQLVSNFLFVVHKLKLQKNQPSEVEFSSSRQNPEHECEVSRKKISGLQKWSAEFINNLKTCGFNLKCLFMRITFNLAYSRRKGEGKDISLS